MQRGKHNVVQVMREPGLFSKEARHRTVPGLYLAHALLGPEKHLLSIETLSLPTMCEHQQ